ncbi:MAG: sulfatase/phosphatase domain-containing protein, partial [Verrucomicrobiota bacterium]
RIFNAGMKGGKGSVNEGGCRVPLFFRLPGVTEAGRDLAQLARHIDLFPTFAELAGMDVSDFGLEGRSLMPLLGTEDVPWPDRTLFFHAGRWPKKGAPGKRGLGDPNPDSYQYGKFAVRTKDWRLVGDQTLYDLTKDPGETTNVFEEHPEVAADLLKEYDAWWNQARPLLVNEDAPLDVEKPFEATYLEQEQEEGIPAWDVPTL